MSLMKTLVILALVMLGSTAQAASQTYYSLTVGVNTVTNVGFIQMYTLPSEGMCNAHIESVKESYDGLTDFVTISQYLCTSEVPEAVQKVLDHPEELSSKTILMTFTMRIEGFPVTVIYHNIDEKVAAATHCDNLYGMWSSHIADWQCSGNKTG